MQFKHPEILYALFLLLIPIIVHLFQLRKFEKVAFTNVQFLKKIALQTRKSSRLKKLLILLTRMLLFTALIIAFAQPYLSKVSNNNQFHTYIYLDNSLSMQVKGKRGELLKIAIQDIIETTQNSTNINLYTNDNKWVNLTSQELKNTLLSLEYYPIEKDLKSVLLSINNDISKQKNTTNNVFLISDYQNVKLTNSKIAVDTTITYNYVQLQPAKKTNISIDSVYISSRNNETITLKAIVKSFNSSANKIPVSLYDENVLLGKSTISIPENSSSEIEFKIPFDNTINGRLSTRDENLTFDNELYFTINQTDKINVIVLGNSNTFLEKIYTEDEYNFTNTKLNELDYNSLTTQNLIVLNELENIPLSLISSLSNAVDNGSHLVIIPHFNSNLNAYNSLLKTLAIGSISAKNENELNITNINFTHPFFANVFEKSIKNFQYPKVNTHYTTAFKNSSAIINFENETAFISQIPKQNSTIYWVSAAINNENSNFKNSPLIVPTFYNFGKYSYKYSQLDYTIGRTNELEIKVRLQKDAILEIATDENSFIPIQQVGNTSVKITTTDLPIKEGFYSIKNNDNILKSIAYNYDRKESKLVYTDIKNQLTKSATVTRYYNSIKEAFTIANNTNKTTNLWKLFLIGSIVFIVIELLLLKFFKL